MNRTLLAAAVAAFVFGSVSGQVVDRTPRVIPVTNPLQPAVGPAPHLAASVTPTVGSESSPADGGPGDVIDTPDTCDATTGGPPSITISPNPTTSKPLFRSGDLAQITVVSSDPSERQSPLTPVTQKGVSITWDLSALTALGIQPTVATTPRASDPKTSDSVLTFTVPPLTAARGLYLTVVSRDVFECGRTVQFAIRLEPNNQPPVAKIQYKIGLASYVNAPTTAVTIETGSPVTVTLKGDTSTDDAGTSNLVYSWTKTDSIATGSVTLGSASGATTTLQIAAHTRGTLAVALTAKDQGNLTSTATISFNIVDPTPKPIARVTATVAGQPLTGSVEAGTVVTLDGRASSRPDNTKDNLAYQWTQIQGPVVSITNADKAVASFTAPAATESSTRLTFKLMVTDGATSSDPVELTLDLSIPGFYFSQVAVGPLGTSQFRTVLLLVNRTEEPAIGVELRFFGQDGNPMDVTINGEPWDSAPFNIPALTAKRLVFTGQDLKAGWAKIKANVKMGGLLQYQIVGADGDLESQVGLFATDAATSFATFFDLTAENAIAVANTSSQAATVRIRLIDEKHGNEVLSKNLFATEPGGVLPAMNHKAKFLTSEFLGELPPDFSVGTLLVESDVPVAVTLLQTKGGVVFSTLPVLITR